MKLPLILTSPLFDESAEGSAAAGGATTTTTTTATEPDLKAEVARLTRERDDAAAKAKEHEDSARFWHSKARGSAEAPEAKTAAKADEEDNTDLLEVAAKGPKAMKEWLAKQGFVSKAEVDNLVTSKASQMTREARLVEQFPELKDQKSEFFKDTATEYGALKSQGVPEHIAMELAAERVSIRRGGTDDGEGRTKKETDDADRKARVKAQAGEGTKRQMRTAEEGGDELDETQKMIADKFGISHEAYKKRAKEGVQRAR
jgi:hypothetical protein